MKNDEYKKVSRGLGQEIRNLMNDALTDARYMIGRRELNERLTEMLPDEEMAPVREALAKKFTQYAKAGQDRRARWELRGRISQLALHVVTELEKGDRLVPVQEEEPIDMDAMMKATDKYSDRVGGELDRAHDEEVAAAREIVRKAGL